MYARDVVVSPDGKSVYAASLLGDVVSFHRDQSTGWLSPRGCIADAKSDSSATRCARTAPGLYEAVSIAISPDGRSVYVGGLEGTISEFRRTPDGKLTFVDCVAGARQSTDDHHADGCSVHDGVGTRSIVVSPDGRYVYAASPENYTVTEFARDPSSGRLTFSQCADADEVPDGYERPRANCSFSNPGLFAVADLAISPDGADLYAVSGFAQGPGPELHAGAYAVVMLARDPGTGRIASATCLSGVPNACASSAYGSATSVALSPDGDSAYLSTTEWESDSGDAVFEFARAQATGRLGFIGCIGGRYYVFPKRCPQHRAGSARSLTVSPDGRSVYSLYGDTVGVMRRNRHTGELAPDGCIAQRGVDSCRRTAKMVPRALAFSPDGRFAYGAEDRAVSIFRRNTRFGVRSR